MLDFSNNNGSPDFRRVYASGHRRIYLKVTESVGFTDKTYLKRRAAAHKAGLKTGGYHFAHATHTPAEEAAHFLAHLGRLDRHHDLRPCLDLEYGNITPSLRIGRWAREWLQLVQKQIGARPLLYGSAWYLEACAFGSPPVPLWLASFGRNDGKEYAFSIPRPWKSLAAHQYSSRATVAGCNGPVDISHVFAPRAIDLP